MNKTRYSLFTNYLSEMKSSIDKSTKDRLGEDSNYNLNINTNIKHEISKNLFLDLNINNILNRDNRMPAGSTLTKFENGAFTKGREILFNIKYKF